MKHIEEKQTNFEIIIDSLLQLALATYRNYKDILENTAEDQLDSVCYNLQELVDNYHKFKEQD